MSKEQFEEALRQKLKGYQPEVDTKQLFKDIKKQQPTSYVGWVSIFLLAMGMGAGLAFLNTSGGDNLLNTNNQNDLIDDQNNYSLNQITIAEDENSSISQNNTTQFSNKESVQSSNEQNQLENNTLVETQKESTQQKNLKARLKNSKSNNNKTDYFASNKTTSKVRNSLGNNFVAIGENENNTFGEIADLIQSEAFEIKKFSEQIEIDDESDLKSLASYDLPINNTEEKIDKSDVLPIESENGIAENTEIAFSHTEYSKDIHPNASDKMEEFLDLKGFKDDKGNTADKKRKPNNSANRFRVKGMPSSFELTTEATIGPMFPLKKLTANGEEYEQYAAERRATETVVRGYSAKVAAIGEFKKRAYFKVGIDYAGFSEAFNFTGVSTRQYWDPNGLSSIEVGPTGDTTYVYDSILVTQNVQRRVSAQNTYQMLDLSTSIGVKYAKSKWAIFADAGLAYNLMFKNKGRYLDESLQPAAFDQQLTNGNFPIRKNLGLAVVGNIGFAYEIKPNFNFNIHTGYKRYFNNFSTDQSPVNQKYQFIDLGMGFQYTFNNF